MTFSDVDLNFATNDEIYDDFQLEDRQYSSLPRPVRVR